MRTIEVKLYEFNELSDEAKQKAIRDNSEINMHYDWWDCTHETWKEIGVRIDSFDLYKQHVGFNNLYDYEDIAQSILSFFGEENDTYAFAKEYLEQVRKLDEESEDYDEDKEALEEEFYIELENTIFDWLRTEYEWLISDEAIAETLEVNEYEFTENGSRYDHI